MEEEDRALLSDVKIEIDVAEETPPHMLWMTDQNVHGKCTLFSVLVQFAFARRPN